MDFNTPGYENLELSTQILIKEAFNRGAEVEVLDSESNFIRIIKGDKTEYIKQATRTSADTYISPLIMENKFLTKLLLKENNLRIPEGETFNNISSAIASYNNYKNKDIVIKPNSTNFGKGISIISGEKSKEDFENAVNLAFKYDSLIIIEEYIPGKEYRFLIINDRVLAVLHRIPANITGDGINNIKDLVIKKNKDPLRGHGYKTPLEKIKLGDAEKQYLKIQEKDFLYIPAKGEQVFLRKNSNISTGGDSIDCTDEIPDFYKEIAVNATRAVNAKICGADIIIRDLAAIPNNNSYGIIELNFNPALHIHNFPFKGKNRFVEKAVLDLLGF